MSHLVAPSVLSADFAFLHKDIEMLNKSQADWFHVDIMDGVFVPNISFGFPVMSALKQYAKKPLDVHLMIVEPDRYIDEFKKHGAEILTVHYEACTHLHRTFQRIKAAGMKAGVSLNPHTPVNVLESIIVDADMVLIMSVNPGFGGQSFIPEALNKVKELKQMITRKQSKAIIEVDGGVDLQNYKELIKAGVSVLVAGSTVFKSQNPPDTIAKLKQI